MSIENLISECGIRDKSEIRTKSKMKAAFPIKGDHNYVDHLDEDPVKKDFRFIIMTYISPEGIRGTNTRAIKIRDFTGGSDKDKAYEKAKKLSEKYREMDGGKFDTFVLEVGKFVGLRTDQYEDINYAESELNDLVKGHMDSIEKSKKAHENRMNEIKNLQKDDARTKAIKERLKSQVNENNNIKENKQKEELKTNYNQMPSGTKPKLKIDSLGCGAKNEDDNNSLEVKTKKSKRKHKHKNKTPSNENSQTVCDPSTSEYPSNENKTNEQTDKELELSVRQSELEALEKNLQVEVDNMNKKAEELNLYRDKIKTVEDAAEKTKSLYKSVVGSDYQEPEEVRKIKEVYNQIKKQSCRSDARGS